MSLPAKVIVTRFSAMGDVAMVASVLKEFALQYPDVELHMVSRPAFKAFFQDIPSLSYHPIYPKEAHAGIGGLYRLYKELKEISATAVADLHYNLRSRILGSFFRFGGYRVKQLNKGRKEKNALIRRENRILKPLRPTVERYADVFREIGFIDFKLQNILVNTPKEIPELAKSLFADRRHKVVGIAPFAQHSFKVLPFPKMEKVIAGLSQLGYVQVIFGGGKEEAEIAAAWARKYPNVYNSIGKFTLSEELAIIANLDLMVSMDSSGMHMASLMGIKCVSIWGATHPYAGFLGYGQSIKNCVQVDHPNRPGSIYGNYSCLCDGVEAINLVTPQQVIDKVKLASR